MTRPSPLFLGEGFLLVPLAFRRSKAIGAKRSYSQGEHMAKEVIVYSNVG
jgi:hypothetical protein